MDPVLAMKISLTILGEPASKANSRKIVMMGRGPKARPAVIKSEKALEYEAAALVQIPPAARVMLEGELRVTIHVYYASERPDLDESVILDVLQAKYAKRQEGEDRQLERTGVYLNDRQVREKHVYHHVDRANPRAEIEVEQRNPAPAALFEQLPVPVKEKPKRRHRVVMEHGRARIAVEPTADGNPF